MVNTCLLFPVKANKSGSCVQVSFADRGGRWTVKNAAWLTWQTFQREGKRECGPMRKIPHPNTCHVG